MTGPRIGELFAGYGGLGMGVQTALGGDVVWYSDVCKFSKDGTAGHYQPHRGACAILAHRFPGVPNLGDVAAVDWSQVEPVDVLTGGSPCQDLSHAGRRAGMTEGTRSNLWVAMREAIAQLHPPLVIWENVRGAYSAEATSGLVDDPRLLADTRRRDGEPVLRALGRVLGDLSDLGYDASWHGLRAADVGAPHGRLRVFVVAADAKRGGLDGWAPHAVGQSLGRAAAAGGGESARGQVALLPTPAALDGIKAPAQYAGGNPSLPGAVKALLPTPAVNDMGEGKTVEAWDEWTAKMKAAHGNGNGHGPSLAIEAQRLLPTPKTVNRASRKALTQQHWTRPGLEQAIELADGILPREYESREEVQGEQPTSWGQYTAAIARWQLALGRPAPAPTMTSTRGNNPQLSPVFVEWMMGLPAGWVTDVPGITRNEALKALGNGVVPQQAAAALREMFAWSAVSA